MNVNKRVGDDGMDEPAVFKNFSYQQETNVLACKITYRL